MANPKKLTTGSAYRNFDSFTIKVEQWLHSLNLKISLCNDIDVRKRVLQKIVEETNEAFINNLKKFEVENAQENTSDKLLHKNFSLDASSGEVKLSSIFIGHQISIFFYFWGRLLIHCLMKLCISEQKKTVSATFLFEAGGGYEVDDTKFQDFCGNGPVSPLVDAKHLIILSKMQQVRQSNSKILLYCKDPIFGYFSSLMGKWDQLNFLANHLLAPLILFQMLLRNPILALVARDCAYLPAYAFLNRKKLLSDIIVTNSQFTRQFLWMKGLKKQSYRLHMIWYSQNFIPKKYIGEEIGSDLPSARHIRVDIHWVWTVGFMKYLKNLGQKNEIKVVGPLIWYLKESSNMRLVGDYSIVLFDVMPVKSSSNVFGAFYNYYSFETLSSFVKDAIYACNCLSDIYGVKIFVYLKHKRALTNAHDLRYIDYIDKLSQKFVNFCVLDSNLNLFELIEASDLSVVVPYTSTAYVSASLRKKAIYYDASARLIPSFEQSEFISYAGNYSCLLNEIEAKLFYQ